MPAHSRNHTQHSQSTAQQTHSRRDLFLGGCAAAASGVLLRPAAAAEEESKPGRRTANRIAVSTYSYWRYRDDSKLGIEECIDLAADAGFDGVEILHVQMQDESNPALQRIKQRAFRHGLDLCGFSTHQSFVSPDPAVRQKNVEHTIHCIELAYALGIPTIRVNTGRWGTSKDFDELMANRGIEPRLEGYTDEDGFSWVIEGLEKCLPTAERCGVVLGLENHWGLGRTAGGVLHVINASRFALASRDVGYRQLLGRPVRQYKQLAPEAVFVQAKTYYGGGTWYDLEIDYQQVATILREVNYRGYISLEFEGKERHETAIPKSLAMLRAAFA